MYNMFCNLIDRYYSEIIINTGENSMPTFLKWLAIIIIHCRPQSHCKLRTPWQLWVEHIDPDKSLFSKPEGIGAPIGRMSS